MNRQIRVAILGKYTTYPSYFNIGSLEGAYRNECIAFPIPLLPQKEIFYIKKQIDFYKPDYLLCHCIFDKKPWMMVEMFEILNEARKKWGTKVCYHMGDARKTPRYPHDISDIVDLGLVNHGEFESFSKIWNIPCIHWPYGCLYQKKIAYVNQRLICEIAFTGSIDSGEHHKERKEFIKQLYNKINNIKIYPDEYYGNSMFMTDEVSASSNVVLGTQMGKDIHLYEDVRPFQYIGSGAVYFHEDHSNIKSFFGGYIHFIPFESNNINDFMRKYAEYHNNESIHQNAFEFGQKYHSTKERFKMILDFFNNKALQNIYLK
jgi:hypothetical protein